MERISWNDPIATFASRIPRKSASFHDPKVTVRTPKEKRIPLGTLTVLARRMLAYERLERTRGSPPRALRRLAASASVRPDDVTSAVPIW